MAEQVEEILEQAARRCDEAEVYLEEGETRSVRFENNRLKRSTSRQFRGVGLRVLQEGRIGFASTTDLREPGRIVGMAEESAQYGQQARFSFPGRPGEVPEVETEDPAVGEVSLERMVEMGRAGLQMSREANDEYLFSADVSTKLMTVRIANTGGLDCSYMSSDMAGTVEVQEVGENGLLRAYEMKSWGRPFDSIAPQARAALEKMRLGSRIAPAEAEVLPVIFTPKSAGNLISPLMTALSGKRVHKGSSVLAGRLEEQIVDERISIYDDPTIPFAPASGPFDDEGVPSGRRALLEQGVLKGYLLDLQTAGLLGMEPTANAGRSYATQPSPSSSNTVLAAGDAAYEEMVEGLERGVIVDQTLGSGQSNTLAGEFSVNVSLGFLVENGEVAGRVKDCMVAGNVYEVLSRLEGIGREREWMGSNHLPAICVGGIKLAVSR